MITPITATFPALNFPKEVDYPTQEDWAAFSDAAELNYGILSGTWSDKSEEFKEQTNNLALEIQEIGENAFNAISLDTIEDLATYAGTGLVMIKDISRGGTFVSKAVIEIDPITGTLYAANDGTVFTKLGGGFWVRQDSRNLKSNWFDIKGDGTTDDTIKIQNALNLGLEIDFESKTYKCTDTLTFKSKVNGNGALFKFYGTTIDTLCFKNIESDIDNIYIDGENVTNCKYGFFNDAEYEPNCETYDGIKVSNIKHSSQPSMGIVVHRSSSSSFIKGNFIAKNCEVNNVNGTGVGKGIMFSFTNSSKSNILIDSSVIDTITPVADGDAIHITTANYSSELPDDNTFGAVIINNNIKSSVPMKRGIKVQYPNTKVLCNFVNGDNITIGYDTYGFNTVFDGSIYIQTNALYGEAYNIHKKGCIISNAYIDMSSSAQAIRIVDSPNTKLNNITLKYRGTPAGDTLGMITLQGASTDCIFSNINTICDNIGGASILMEDSSSAILSNSILKGNKFGIRNNYCSGSIKIDNSLIGSSDSGFKTFGTLGFKFNLSNSKIIAETGIYSYSSGNYSKINIDNAEIECTLNGILGNVDDVIKNSYIKNTGTKAGVGILGATGFKATGNATENFTTGIQYTYSTNTIVSNNVSISCTTPILKTGSTDFVFTDNFSR